MGEKYACSRLEITHRHRNPLKIKLSYLSIDENCYKFFNDKSQECKKYEWNNVEKGELCTDAGVLFFRIHIKNSEIRLLKIFCPNHQKRGPEIILKAFNEMLERTKNQPPRSDSQTTRTRSFDINLVEQSIRTKSYIESNHPKIQVTTLPEPSTSKLSTNSLDTERSDSQMGHTKLFFEADDSYESERPDYSERCSIETPTVIEKAEAFSTERVVDGSSQLKLFQYRCLPNTGNSCYFNSVMQALASSAPFVWKCNKLSRLFHSDKFPSFDSKETENAYRLVEGVVMMIDHLAEPSSKPMEERKLEDFRRRAGKVERSYDNNNQQDAHDYLLLLFSALDIVLAQNLQNELISFKNDSKGTSVRETVSEMCPITTFTFTTESTYTCEQCGCQSKKTEKHNMLQVPIKPGVLYQKLPELIMTSFQYTEVEKKCSECVGKSAKSEICISTLPKCLILNLQRYYHEKKECKKINCKVEVQLELDLSTLISSNTSDYNTTKEHETSQRHVRPPNFDNATSTEEKIRGSVGFSQPQLLLGGARKESGTPEVVEYLAETTNVPLYFKLLTNLQEVQEMLGILGIGHEKDKLKIHLSSLSKEPGGKMNKNDPPSKKQRVHGDGNCFFRSISWCLTGSQRYHEKIRRSTVKYLEENQKRFENYSERNIKTHINEMRQVGVWATQCEIAAVASLLNINIYTFLPTGWNCQGPKNGSISMRSGSLYLTNLENHYDSVIALEMKSNSSAQRTRKRNVSKDDDDDESANGNGKIQKLHKFKNEEAKSQAFVSRESLKRECKTKGRVNNRYKLVAAVCHYGDSANEGHYRTYVRDIHSGIWFLSDDDLFKIVTETIAVRDITSNGYILFYDREDCHFSR